MSAKELTAEELLNQELGGMENGAGSARLSLRERLQGMFRGDDLVKVKNFTSYSVGWVYSDPKDVDYEQPDKVTRRLVGVGKDYQKARVLKPGETKIVPGWEAYVGLVRFFKDYIQHEYKDKALQGAINSYEEQTKFINKAYLGTYDPNENEEIVEKKTAKEELDEDLGLTGTKDTTKDGGKAKQAK